MAANTITAAAVCCVAGRQPRKEQAPLPSPARSKRASSRVRFRSDEDAPEGDATRLLQLILGYDDSFTQVSSPTTSRGLSNNLPWAVQQISHGLSNTLLWADRDLEKAVGSQWLRGLVCRVPAVEQTTNLVRAVRGLEGPLNLDGSAFADVCSAQLNSWFMVLEGCSSYGTWGVLAERVVWPCFDTETAYAVGEGQVSVKGCVLTVGFVGERSWGTARASPHPTPTLQWGDPWLPHWGPAAGGDGLAR